MDEWEILGEPLLLDDSLLNLDLPEVGDLELM